MEVGVRVSWGSGSGLGYVGVVLPLASILLDMFKVLAVAFQSKIVDRKLANPLI